MQVRFDLERLSEGRDFGYDWLTRVVAWRRRTQRVKHFSYPITRGICILGNRSPALLEIINPV